MKNSVLALSLLSAVVSAVPAPAQGGGSTSNDIQNGQCGAVTLVMARGSTEPGNMGTIVGGPLCAAMQSMGSVACQGVGGNYQATLQANLQPQGTDQQSIQQAMTNIAQAMTTCPTSTLVLAGYSQGSAVISQAVQSMPAAMQQKVAAVGFWGYTKNQQTMGMLPGYPQAQTFVACRPDDGVCGGQLDVTAGHLAYMNDGSVQTGAAFLMKAATGMQTRAANSSSSGNSTTSASGSSGNSTISASGSSGSSNSTTSAGGSSSSNSTTSGSSGSSSGSSSGNSTTSSTGSSSSGNSTTSGSSGSSGASGNGTASTGSGSSSGASNGTSSSGSGSTGTGTGTGSATGASNSAAASGGKGKKKGKKAGVGNKMKFINFDV